MIMSWNEIYVCVLVTNNYVKLHIWGSHGSLQICTRVFYTLNMKHGFFCDFIFCLTRNKRRLPTSFLFFFVPFQDTGFLMDSGLFHFLR